MTLDQLEKREPVMVALVRETQKRDTFKVPFQDHQRAENFRRTFYKFRKAALRVLEGNDATVLKSITTTVERTSLIFSVKASRVPHELLQALEDAKI